MPNIEDDARNRIASFLPEAMERALQSYRSFLDESEHKNAKEFKAHHDACKVAIAHLELLIKLAEWAHLPDENLGSQQLLMMLENAQAELQRNKHNEGKNE